MYSYRARVHSLYAEALSKAAAVLVAYELCVRQDPEDVEFPDALGELKARFGDLQVAVDALSAVLPVEVAAAGRLTRHMVYGNDYINIEGRPRAWGSDARFVLECDLPAVLDAFDDWYATASGIDPELVERLRPFNGVSHINSAGREAWAIFKTRVIEAYDLPDDIDGHALVDRLFSDDDPVVPSLSDGERRGYRNLLKGLYTLHRNPVAHNDQEPNPGAADAVIALIGICLSRIAPPEAGAGR